MDLRRVYRSSWTGGGGKRGRIGGDDLILSPPLGFYTHEGIGFGLVKC